MSDIIFFGQAETFFSSSCHRMLKSRSEEYLHVWRILSCLQQSSRPEIVAYIAIIMRGKVREIFVSSLD